MLYDTALALARQNIPVYPLVVNTKVPLKGMHGYKDATTDKPTIDQWFKETTNNLAISLRASQLIVLDIDMNHNSQTNGVQSFSQLLDQLKIDRSFMKNTYSERSPNGGFHFFFKVAPNAAIHNVTNAFSQQNNLTGIDLLTTSVTMAPSVINEQAYQPLGMKSGLIRNEVLEAPAWLLKAFKPQHQKVASQKLRTKKYTGKLLDELVQGVGIGQRNNFLTSLTGKMFYVGADNETVYNLLFVANDFLEQPLPDKEVNLIFTSVLKRL